MIEMEIANNYIENTSRPSGGKSSVRNGKNIRFDKAQEQVVQKPTGIHDIIEYTNDFLELLGMKPVINPVVKREALAANDLYQNIKEINHLRDKRDIVWMKFTEDGYLGVVAVGADINFCIPPSEKEYNGNYNSSGIIIHHLEKKWDESFVLIFPLQKIPDGMERKNVENGIGNYLIERGVPILDFYSHRY